MVQTIKLKGDIMSEILLGIDIGTSACKVVAFKKNGEVIGHSNRDYKVFYPQKGWAEQNPLDWWEAICLAIKDLISSGLNPDNIKGIGLDGQSWSAIAIDKQGEVLCNTPIWMDTRAEKICEDLIKKYGEDKFFNVSGNPVKPSYTMPKVLWYKENMPEVYNNTYKILQSNSFIAYKLTDKISQEPSQGYGWNCYDMKKGEWDTSLCEEMGVNPDFLPPIIPCHGIVGTVTKEASIKTGLKLGTPVVAGGLDAACGTLGAGVYKEGQTQEQGGQAGGMSICLNESKADKTLILGAHVVPDLYLLQGGTVGGGGAVNWYEKEFCFEERETAKENGTNSFYEMDKNASEINEGSDGVIFLPYLAGERSPIWDTNAKGVFYGIDFSTTKSHFSRAVMEGVAYSLRHNLETAEKAGANADVLCSMGGAANSRLWTQIKADVTGKKIVVPSSDTATALGAAILAGVGTGIYDSFEQAVKLTVHNKREHIPNKEKEQIYNKGYEKYLKIYQNLKQIMSEE